jgi:small subunit ribosomal protein S23
MVRKLATQVPQAVTRLLQAQTIPQPIWYKPVANHPPSPLPPRQIINRQSAHDLPASASQSGPADHTKTRKMKYAKTPKLKIQPVVYEQRDLIRKRFFEDFPFEALRPTSLVEGRVVNEGQLVEGAAWAELRQRGETPTVEK